MTNATPKKLNLDLVGQDGNAFSLLGYFARSAKAAGWTPEQIAAVRDDATSGDYDHLLYTLTNA